MAWTRRGDAAPLARAGRGGVLRDVLLRLRDALLSGPSGHGARDRTPTPAERLLCRHWRESELALLQPRLIVTVGGLAARELLGLTRVTEFVGTSYDLGGAVAIPLPHPSGASGWLNAPANRARLADALALVSAELQRL